MVLVGVVVLYCVLALLAMIVVMHLAIPYAVIAKHKRGEPGGISGLLGVDWILLLVAALVSAVTGACSVSTLLVIGSCVIVASYLHGIAASVVYNWLERRSRLPTMRARRRR